MKKICTEATAATPPPSLSLSTRSQIILKRAKTLRSSKPRLEPETEPLNVGPIQHPWKKVSHVGVLLFENVGEVSRGISADGPLGRGEQPLIAEDEVVEQLGAFGVRSIFEDGCGLRPGDERRIGRSRGVCIGAGCAARGKGGDVRGVCESKLVARCRASADPSWILRDESVEPFDTELLDAGICQ